MKMYFIGDIERYISINFNINCDQIHDSKQCNARMENDKTYKIQKYVVVYKVK